LLDGFINIVKATRFYRAFISIMVIMVSAAFANTINKDVFVLCLCSLLIYSSASIHNAIKDRDYYLPSYSKKVMLGLIILSLLLSLSNKIIFFAVIIAISLGFIYNTISRFFLFGDTIILSITHFALPSISSSLLLGLNIKFAFILAGFMYIFSWLTVHSKNLKDTEDDKERGYKTLTTIFKNGRIISILLLELSFLFMLVAYFLFNLTNTFLVIFSIIFIVQLVIVYQVIKNKNHSALKLIRLLTILFLFGIIVDRTNKFIIIVMPLSLFLLYLILVLTNSIAKEKYKPIDINATGG